MAKRKPTVKQGATIFRSYIESVESLAEDFQKEWYFAIINRLFKGIYPTFKENYSILNGMWKLIEPNINTSISRSTQGSKGGKQTTSKPQASVKQTPSDKDKDKDRDLGQGYKEEKNIKKENLYRSFKHLSLTETEASKICQDLSVTSSQLDEVLDDIENYKKNTNYTSLNLTARKWLKKRLEDNAQSTEKSKIWQEMEDYAKAHIHPIPEEMYDER